MRRLPKTKAASPSSTAVVYPCDAPKDLAFLKTVIQDALSRGSGWASLVASLEAKGLTLRPKGGGLVLIDTKNGAEICKLSAIGFRYIELIRKFGEGFPEHPASWLVEHALTARDTAKAPSRPRKARGKRKRPKGGGDDMSLIED